MADFISVEMRAAQSRPESPQRAKGMAAMSVSFPELKLGCIRQQVKSLGLALDSMRILKLATEHLQASAHRKRLLAGFHMPCNGGIEPGASQPSQILRHMLGAR